MQVLINFILSVSEEIIIYIAKKWIDKKHDSKREKPRSCDLRGFLDSMQCAYQLCIYIISYSHFICNDTLEQKKSFKESVVALRCFSIETP